jgi:hypothetical protein
MITSVLINFGVLPTIVLYYKISLMGGTRFFGAAEIKAD